MAIPIKVPEVGESITEVVLGKWLKSDGEFVKQDEPICEIESEKATFEIMAEKSGILKIKVPEGENIQIGDVIGEIEEKQPGEKKLPSHEKEKPTEQKEEEQPVGTEKPHPRISPVAAQLLKEAHIPVETVKGSGIGGRITKADALQAIKARESQKSEVTTPPSEVKISSPQAPQDGRPVRRVRMSTLRRTISRRLVQAKNETAMLTTFNEVDLSEIIQIRQRYKETFLQKYGVKLGFMSFFTRACTIALKEFPELNASIEGEDIVYHDYYDIGIAVSTDRGLVVPVIRNADQLSLAQLEAEIARLAEKARQNKLSIDEMSGGTFTITNGGVFGSLLSTPIINYPQSAILGMHKIQERPVVVHGQIVIRPMMYVALSYDHRIIDGRDSVQFLGRVKELLEDPARMLLHI